MDLSSTTDDVGPAYLDGILGGKLATYRVVHLVPVRDLAQAGFALLPTFERPHMTLLLKAVDAVEEVLARLGLPQANPSYGETRRRSGRRPR